MSMGEFISPFSKIAGQQTGSFSEKISVLKLFFKDFESTFSNCFRSPVFWGTLMNDYF